MPNDVLPSWTEDLKRRYLRGEALQFVLYGNVNDLVLSGGRFIRVSDFLSDILLSPSKDVVVTYNVATGVRFAKKRPGVPGLDQLALLRDAGCDFIQGFLFSRPMPLEEFLAALPPDSKHPGAHRDRASRSS